MSYSPYILLLFFFAFVLVTAWLYLPSNKKKLEQNAKKILKD
ncbi:MAG: CcoQ/FixQ family Cbb3-type cytochrome c oxidase assembly chaperone [Alphaproteobacteria bacterium]|jgi:cbb3-type cytochrome oxidase subunit 3